MPGLPESLDASARGMFQSYRQLSSEERIDLRQAAWRLIVVRACLITGIQKTERRLGGRSATAQQGSGPPDPTASPAADQDPLDSAGAAVTSLWERRARALRRVGARLPGTHCLARALALRWWMRSRGLDAQLRIGVRQGPGGLEAHAWVELAGAPVDEQPGNTMTYKLIALDPDQKRSWSR